jgi:hypothetical protein
MPRKLRGYQKKFISWSLSKKCFALFWEMRLGKTLTTIRRIELTPCKNILVIAPFSVLYGWANELKEEQELHTLLDNKNIKKRLEEFEKRISAYSIRRRYWFLCNKEIWKWFPDLYKLKFDCIIIDESVILKNPKAKITNYFINNFREVPYRIILSGLPAPESPLDYYCQIKFLSHDILKEKSYWEFRARQFYNSWGYEWNLTQRGKLYLRNSIKPYCSFLNRNDVSLNNKKIYEREYIELPKEIRKSYDTILKECVLEHNNQIFNKTVFATTVYLWLRKICSGFVMDNFISTHKRDSLLDLLNTNLKNQQIIIWCQYLNEIKSLSILKNSGFINGSVLPSEREALRNKFQSGRIQYLIIQPTTFKYGTKLTAAQTMIYYSTPDGLDTRRQTEDRILDVTSNSGILIIDMLCKKTIEENILNGLNKKYSKAKIIEEFINGLQIERKN